MSFFSHFRSVVIVGASEDRAKIGNILLEKNQHFQGAVYGLNPKGGQAYGHDFYKDYESLPEVPDIAVFALPEPLIYDSLELAGARGIKRAIIITAGFREVGKHAEEDRLHAIAKKYGIRFLGPNCLGYGDTTLGLNLSFGGNFFSPGNIGIISQSGAMAVAITDILESRGLGFSQFFSLGNKTDIDESDLLEVLLEDPHTEVICLYLESISRGERFLRLLRQARETKPVIIMIGGVSDRGKKATASHTGSLSGDRLMYEAAIRQGGAILTYDLGEYFSLLEIFSLSIGKEIAGDPLLVTNAGGIGVLATDQCDFAGLRLAEISESDATILREGMPLMMSTKNPIDIIGDAGSDRVDQILTNIRKIRDRADILFFFTVQATTDIDEIALKIRDFQTTHPMFAIFIGLIGGETVSHAEHILGQAGIFTAPSPERLIGAYQSLLTWKHGSSLSKSEATPPGDHLDQRVVLLDQNSTESLFSGYDIPTTETYEYTTLEAALTHIERCPGPYVMKIAGKHIAHKTEIGGVSSKLISEEDIRSAYTSITERARVVLGDSEDLSVTLGRYITPSPTIEMFFGAKRDPTFGVTFLLGTGGIYLSILDDTRIHIGPWAAGEILEMIKSLRFARALSGFRRQTAADMDALVTLIGRLSDLFFEHPEIRELDINPILFDQGKPIIADAKVYL